MMSLQQIAYALAVEKFRHIGQAARACGVTQPTLSMQLKKLEDHLDYALFDRNKKPILPTARGREFLLQARAVNQEFEKLSSLAGEARDEVAGLFRLGIIPTLSSYIVPLFTENFSKQHPKARLEIEEMKTDEIIAALGKDQIDAGLLATPLQSAGLHEEPLFEESFQIYAAKTHPLSQRKFVTEDELNPSELWLLEEGHCFRNQTLKLCSIKAHRPASRSVDFQSGNLETLKKMVERSGGYTILPTLACRDLRPSKAALVAFKGTVPVRQIGLIYAREYLKRPYRNALAVSIRESALKEIASIGSPQSKTKLLRPS
jgi:LysR family transcriptional regulator, hydrogen peroxide-inducible genes activator